MCDTCALQYTCVSRVQMGKRKVVVRCGCTMVYYTQPQEHANVAPYTFLSL